ncbi:LPXTG cell wall anchor domain-containing protein [Enterococcus gilvus]
MLPKTNDTNLVLFSFIGTLLVGLVLLIFWKRRRKQDEEETKKR